MGGKLNATYDDCPETIGHLDRSGSSDLAFGTGSVHRSGACADSYCRVNAACMACRYSVARANGHANRLAANTEFHSTTNRHAGSTYPHAGAHPYCHPGAANAYGDAGTASYANLTTAACQAAWSSR